MNTAKIIAVTQSLIEGVDSAEDFIAFAARVSNPSNQNNKLTAPKLLKYCAKNSHWSIFEMVNIVMEVETTRDIGRQVLRHGSYKFQEFSQRYADPTDESSNLGFTTRECRFQDTKNRQNSVAYDINDPLHVRIADEWFSRQVKLIDQAEETYKWAITNGIAKEQARAVLPEGLTVSRMYMNGTLRSWIHYCALRSKNGTQKEHMEIAKSAWKAIMVKFPTLCDLELVDVE